MKTYKNLYPYICAWETLETAYRKARKGKRRYQPVADFECQNTWSMANSPQSRPQRGGDKIRSVSRGAGVL